MLDLLNSKTVLTQLVGLLFAALAMFHVGLPASVDQAAFVGLALLILAVVTAVLRFGQPGQPATDAKTWYQSKTIWTQIVAAGFAALAIVGKLPAGVDQAGVVAGVMVVVTIVNTLLHRQTTAAIAPATPA